MIHRPPRRRARSHFLALALLAAAAPAAAAQIPVQPPRPFKSLDNVQAPITNLGAFPVRPMAWTADDTRIYAVNTEANKLLYFDNATGVPGATWSTPNNPVSVALHDSHPDGIPRALVLCRGTHGLVAFDRFTGTILQFVELPHEPADLVIVGTRLFVSCSGANLVRELDLNTFATVRDYPVGAKQPTYLAVDGAGRVLVAPMISGNNSTILGGVGGAIVNTADPLVSPNGGLPDLDLYRIDPVAGTIAPVLKGTGTALFAHGVNPASGAHWQLNVEGKNKDPNKQSEPALKGDFADNRLTLSTLPVSGVNTPTSFLNLDDSDHNPLNGVQFNPAVTVSLPTALCFSSSGFGVITGLATDNVSIFTQTGAFVVEWDLPNQSLPRGVILDPLTQTLLAVYCWGRHVIELYSLAPFNTTPIATLQLGFDPFPPAVQRGRKIFFDASFSFQNHLTCAHCHIEGKTDLLGWNLSDVPKDHKGVMVTQTLFGIERVPPFHWRGERPTLDDFNVAFVGLLGGPAQLSPTDLADFDAFVFSQTPAANPGGDPARLLNDLLAPVEKNGIQGSAIQGQNRFITQPTLGQFTCADCHSLPNATNSDIISENPVPIAQQTNIDVAHFLELWRKEQSIVTLTLAGGGTTNKPELGFGLLHPGTIDDLFDFVAAFGQPPQDTSDITAFIRQFDQGLGGSSHRASRLRTPLPPGNLIQMLLIPQADARNCSLAVVGTFPRLGVPTPLLFAYVPGATPGTGTFVCEDSVVPPQVFNNFVTATAAGQANVIFYGMPPGSAPWTIDVDGDALVNLDEGPLGCDPFDSDSDNDTFPDGHEVQNGGNPTNPFVLPNDTTTPAIVRGPKLEWINTKLALVTFETSEPTTFNVTYSTTTGPILSTSGSTLTKVHRALLKDLFPSTNLGPPFGQSWTYNGTLKVTDAAGLWSAMALPTGLTTLPFIAPNPLICVVGDLQWTQTQKIGGTLNAIASARVDFKLAGPPAIPAQGEVLVAYVLKNGAITPFTTAGPTGFSIFGNPYGNTPDELTGPFLISAPTGANGQTTFNFTVNGLVPGDTVTVAILAVLIAPPGYNPAAPDFNDPNNPLPLALFSFPDTPKLFRDITTVF